ncbi:MAG TPA: RICIN domain-containing protein [Pilimelia sp.]|nr:RICIN domain-containing protein [Pilimelia sp.]
MSTPRFPNVRRLGSALCALAVSATILAATPAYADPAMPGHVYRITTTGSLAVEVAGASHDNGAPVIQWPVKVPDYQQNQQWRLEARGGGTFWLRNMRSGKCLTVADASHQPGAGLVQHDCNDGANERWYLNPVNSNTMYKIRSVATAYVMDVPNGTVKIGTQLIQYPDHDGPNQQFYLTMLA